MARRLLLIAAVLTFIAVPTLSQDKQREELAQLRRLVPPSQAFDRWLDKYGQLPPDFEQLPAQPYPQPLLDGIQTREQWSRRRAELRKAAEKWLFGHAPGAPGNVRAVIEEKKEEENREVWTARLEFGPDHAARLHCWLWLPKSFKAPLPVFMVDNNRYTRFAEEAFSKGTFAICIYNATDPVYSADKKDESEAYNDLFGKYDWSEFYRRGWSASRALDWLSTLDFVAKDKVFIGGHSRSAKQSLVGAAFDDRIAGVIASSPGSGGSLHYRYTDQYYYGESIERLTTVFPYWASPTVRFFAGRENKLPADMHYIYALIAPRPVLMSTAVNDSVENTWVVEQMYQSIHPVWQLLGAPGNLTVRYRIGKHAPDEETYRAHSRFLELAAAGKNMAEAFPFRPLHPWDYEQWAKANPAPQAPSALNVGSSAAGDLHQQVRSRIQWLLGQSPRFEPFAIQLGVGESDEAAARLNRTGSNRLRVRFGDGINGNFHYPPGRNPSSAGARAAEKLPTVIWLAPLHTSTGYVPGYRVGDIPHTKFSRSGYLVLAFDPIGTADRQEERREFYSRYPRWSLMGKMVLDAQSAIDAALKNPDVDAQRIYLVGFGMGGMVATFTAAMDDRVAGVATVCGFTPFRADTDASPTGGIRRWSHLYGWMPRLGGFVGREREIPVDFEAILGSIAPRRLLVIAPTMDWHSNPTEVSRAVQAARAIYEKQSAGAKLVYSTPEALCEFNNEMQSQVIEFLKNTN